MSARTCPICGTKLSTAQQEAFPFCSPRCKLIDLGNWLGDRYSVPDESTRSANCIEDEQDEREPAA